MKYCGVVTVDGSGIPNNHLGWCQKPVVNNWCRLTISTGFHAGFLVAINSTRQGNNISHLGKRKLIFKNALVGDMLIPRRVSFLRQVFSGKIPDGSAGLRLVNCIKVVSWSSLRMDGSHGAPGYLPDGPMSGVLFSVLGWVCFFSPASPKSLRHLTWKFVRQHTHTHTLKWCI